MIGKILLLGSDNHSIEKISKSLRRKCYEIITPSETESAFTLIKNNTLSAVIVDEQVFGKKKHIFLQNLKENVLPKEVSLFTVSTNNQLSTDKMLKKVDFAC